MNNITSDEQINDETPLTRTQVKALFRELEEQRNREREIQTNGVELSLAISETLENSSTTQLKDEFRRYKKTIQRYNHPDWISVQQINKEYIPDLKNWKVDTYQLVSSIYKNTETIRIQTRASTEIYEQLQYLQEKFQENDAKDLSLKVLRLPPNDGKTNAFDHDFVEQLQKARFEDKITRNATMSGRGNFRRGPWRGN
ncbi:hypothetical protein K501DRAFT_292396 [Backusella circina FSU 941]|nr:hypothetical protein K501DRAFT_292396 [Backusella circina FSU 941]